MKNKLKAMRESKGLSQAQLSEKSGVHLRTLQYYEQNRLNINGCKVEKIFSLALALDCDIEDILDDPETIEKVRQYQEA